jgi:2-polyprenyl-3-methyl-5-hydroxy-6-metoxy-1,4-benzoquinol methylase
MSSVAIRKYFDATENRAVREDRIFAINNIHEPRIAIDCGCGAGADVNFLASNGFTVHGFDIRGRGERSFYEL